MHSVAKLRSSSANKEPDATPTISLWHAWPGSAKLQMYLGSCVPHSTCLPINLRRNQFRVMADCSSLALGLGEALGSAFSNLHEAISSLKSVRYRPIIQFLSHILHIHPVFVYISERPPCVSGLQFTLTRYILFRQPVVFYTFRVV